MVFYYKPKGKEMQILNVDIVKEQSRLKYNCMDIHLVKDTNPRSDKQACWMRVSKIEGKIYSGRVLWLSEKDDEKAKMLFAQDRLKRIQKAIKSLYEEELDI